MNDHPTVPIAVVGVGAIMPDAPDVATFWSNITGGRYSIGDVPKQRWDADLYYDPDRSAPDRTYSRIGGWVREFDWDPLSWHLPVPPTVAAQMDEGQRWAVNASRAALLDAGWPGWTVDPERVAVIIGTAIGGEKQYRTCLRIEIAEMLQRIGTSPSLAELPAAVRAAVMDEARTAMLAGLPTVTEDTMPGELANVTAGRVANLFNFRGPNFTADAACASGLAAMTAAVHGLRAREFDAVVTGGLDRNMGVAAFVKFCKIGALSATGSRPFDAGADGFVMGEGAALFVLKRLADAEAHGDRIYAVLLGLGGSSDGRGKGITAPNPAGQRLAVDRAWHNAGVDPALASYVEAHGTSTGVGDATELEVLSAAFGGAGVRPGSIALGSVKSNIGHLKAAAGAAGVLKVVLSLHHGVLPPSLHFDKPNSNVDWASIPLRVNTVRRDWPDCADGPRYAGVSAFGFGGTNFHAVLAEYKPGRFRDADEPRAHAVAGIAERTITDTTGPTQDAATAPKAPLRGAAVVGGRDDADVVSQLTRLGSEAAQGRVPEGRVPDPALASAEVRVAVDFADPVDLATKTAKAVTAMTTGGPAMLRMLRAQGVFVGRGRLGKVAFLYPGQGSQYINMMRELCAGEPVVADTFAEADRVMTPLLGCPLTELIFSDNGTSPEAMDERLQQTEVTQPAVLTTDIALTRLLESYGVRPDMVMGHSLGEYAALVAAGSLSFEAALEAVSARGREMAGLRATDPGAMAAVAGRLDDIERIVAGMDGNVVVANINSTSQAVIGGATAAVEQAIASLTAAGMTVTRLPVSHAFHTSIVAPASGPLTVALRRLDLRAPALPVVANVTGDFYPPGADTESVIEILARQVASPVQFVKGLRTLYDAGARVFVEVGPKRALHGFVSDVLAEHDDVLALFTNHPKLGDIAAFNHALCGLYAAGPALLGTAEPKPTRAREAHPVTVPATVSESTRFSEHPVRPAIPADRYLELGRLFASVLEEGRRIYDEAAPAPSPASAGTAPVVVTGAALGLPGVEHVFDDDNVDRILQGQQLVDAVPHRLRRAMADRYVASPDLTGGYASTIDDGLDVVTVAGRRAPLDLVGEFGIDRSRDAFLDEVTRLAVGAGFDALRDAGIPLVDNRSVGGEGPNWALPSSMQADTGVIFASTLAGYDVFTEEVERYLINRGRREQLQALEAVRGRLGEDGPALSEVDRRIHDLRRILDTEPFVLDRRFLDRCLGMGHSQFADIIGAGGPTVHVDAASAGATSAICLAEDWIRSQRCGRVIVVSAADASSDRLLPWIASAFLARGEAGTGDMFDPTRSGVVVGAGAAAFVIESAEAAAERGVRPICEILGSATATAASLDAGHLADMVTRIVDQADARGVDRTAMAAHAVLVPPETYGRPRDDGAALVAALRDVFGSAADQVVVTSTTALTGHTMGCGVEEAAAVKMLETGIVPPVPSMSMGGAYPLRYALRVSGGLGSQMAALLLSWTAPPDGRHRKPCDLGYAYRIVDAARWRQWIAEMSEDPDATVEVVQRRLRVRSRHNAPLGAADDQSVHLAESSPPAGWVPSVEPVESPGEPPTSEPVVPVSKTDSPDPPEPEEAAVVVGIVSGLTGYPPELLDVDLDLEADLGVDTVKQAEIFAAVRERFGAERDESLRLRDFPTLAHVIGWIRDHREIAQPGAQPSAESVVPLVEPAATGGPALDEAAVVVGIVSGLTGYPPELLDVDLDLEADLGVDTVKQAEIFAAVRERFGAQRDETLRLRDFPTLAHVIGWIRDHDGSGPQPAGQTESAAATGTRGPESDGDESVYDGQNATADGLDESATVVEIVSGLTGYPPELLDVDLDLEADLGVDTVKQAEIFAAVRERFGVERDESLRLRDFPTLAHVIQWIEGHREHSEPGWQEPHVPSTEAAAARSATGKDHASRSHDQSVPAPLHVSVPVVGDLAATDRIPRRVPVPAVRPDLSHCRATGVRLDGARVIVMADRGGVAAALGPRLLKRGAAVLDLDPGVDEGDLLDQLDAWLSDGCVAGVYWLPALDDEGPLDGLDLAGWRSALKVRVGMLYTTMRKLSGHAPFLVAGTRMGGRHGYDETGATCPLGGAVTGFAKAYRRELPETLVKTVDFTTDRTTADLADLLIDETLTDPGCVEVGYSAGLRWGVGLVERPFAELPKGLTLDASAVVVVTGAAGSIVSAIVADLARASAGTFHLLDVVPEPDPTDADLRLYVEDPEGLKVRLADRIRARGERPTPVLIQRQLARLERLEAALAAIQAVRDAGGTPYYHQVDLTDEASVQRTLTEIGAAHNRIDVLLHAAGVEVSHSLVDKEPAEFDRVLAVKADGLFNVLRSTRDLPIAISIVFSSVAARFGNAGQTDYAAANDLLCKVTSSLRRTRPGTRAVALDWTAWGGIGMASRGSIPTVMERAGVEVLPPQGGTAWIRREITSSAERGEVVVAGALGRQAAELDRTGGIDPATLPLSQAGPMVGEVTKFGLSEGLIVTTTLDPKLQPFLDHHRIDGTAVLPGVMGIEAFAEVARILIPDWHVTAIEDVRFLSPVKFYHDQPRTITIVALVHPDGEELVAQCRLEAERMLPGSARPQRTVHFTGSVRLSTRPSTSEPAINAIREGTPQLIGEHIYRMYFHGPAYKVLGSAWRAGDAVAGRLASDLPVAVDPAGAPMVTQPRMVELAFQTAGLWEVAEAGRLGLPVYVGRLRLLQPLAETASAVALARPVGGGYACDVVDERGEVILTMEDYRTMPVPDLMPDDVRAPVTATLIR
jgi:acyl transferase domain-containing protein/acyl carrier protein